MDSQSEPSSRLSMSWRAAMLILLLTLIVWVLFWQWHMPLDPGATAIVALAVTLIVTLGRFTVSRLHRLRAGRVKKPQ